MSADFDINDEYQVHAYMVLGFWCSDCRRELPIDSSHEVATDKWCLDAARHARAAGWYVPPVDGRGGMDVETTYCTMCAASRRLTSA